MTRKRPHSSQDSEEQEDHGVKANLNPPKQRGLQSLARTVSPPPQVFSLLNGKKVKGSSDDVQITSGLTAAAIEAGEQTLSDHLTFYAAHLLKAIHDPDLLPNGTPRLSHAEWVSLYNHHASKSTGCHFVVHQHDHPIAGLHYDLRLQCNPTSSISFAIMYGLPGDPNSRRKNRNATETRVHCLWNHVVEMGSWESGSMLIWDTGRYEVLPRAEDLGQNGPTSTDEDSSDDSEIGDETKMVETEQEKLKRAFQIRKIKLRLHGTRLPVGYTLGLRLTKENDRNEQPKKPRRRRKRIGPGQTNASNANSESDKESSEPELQRPKRKVSSLSRLASPPLSPRREQTDAYENLDEGDIAVASDDEDEMIRGNNAYPGATNDIGSIHQRKWYLSVDRVASGFVKRTTKSRSGFLETTWICKQGNERLAQGDIEGPSGFDRFVVGGRETERSVVTGRLGQEILMDEGVSGYVPRGLWRAVTE